MPRAIFPVIIVSGLLLFACSALHSGFSVPIKHPYELPKGRPTCSECHESTPDFPFANFNHTPAFAQNHRFQAYQSAKVCAMCHAQSFCNQCHTTSVELKPSVKDPSDTYRTMYHRGDYLSRHRIDGRIDPTSCFRCHGNPMSSKICVQCHGK